MWHRNFLSVLAGIQRRPVHSKNLPRNSKSPSAGGAGRSMRSLAMHLQSGTISRARLMKWVLSSIEIGKDRTPEGLSRSCLAHQCLRHRVFVWCPFDGSDPGCLTLHPSLSTNSMLQSDFLTFQFFSNTSPNLTGAYFVTGILPLPIGMTDFGGTLTMGGAFSFFVGLCSNSGCSAFDPIHEWHAAFGASPEITGVSASAVPEPSSLALTLAVLIITA